MTPLRIEPAPLAAGGLPSAAPGPGLPSPISPLRLAAARPSKVIARAANVDVDLASFGTLLDLESVLFAAEVRLRDTRATTHEGQLVVQQNRALHERIARNEALAAARKTGRISKLLRGKLGKVLKAITVGAALAAIPVTGGASAALLVAGTTLMLSGSRIAASLESRLGPEGAMWLGMGLQLAGALLTAGASGASAGASASSCVSASARTVASIASASSETLGGLTQVGAAVVDLRHDRLMVRADARELAADRADDAALAHVDALRQTFESFARVVGRLSRTATLSNEGRRAAANLLV